MYAVSLFQFCYLCILFVSFVSVLCFYLFIDKHGMNGLSFLFNRCIFSGKISLVPIIYRSVNRNL